MSLEEDHQSLHRRGEVVKFAILVAVMLVTVLVVALVRPLIFDEIVPAVLGWRTEESAPVPASPTPLPSATRPAAPATLAPTVPAAEQQPAAELSTPTPPPTPAPQVYQVQPGDNLTEIARRHAVSLEALMEANNLPNPNRIMPGDRLIIP